MASVNTIVELLAYIEYINKKYLIALIEMCTVIIHIVAPVEQSPSVCSKLSMLREVTSNEMLIFYSYIIINLYISLMVIRNFHLFINYE